jgi:tetratricopeptide (TPR) repeat protein
MTEVIAIDARGFHGVAYKGAAALIDALFQRQPETAADAARDRLVTLAPIAPGVRRWMNLPYAVERALEVTREGRQPGWSQRVAHGVTDFALGCLGREGGPTHVTVVNLSTDERLDLEFFHTLQRRADPDRLTLELVAASGPSPPLEGDAEAFAAEARRCMDLAYHEAALVWASLAEAALGDRRSDPLRARIAHEKLFALLLLDRLDEVEALCATGLSDGSDPMIQLDAGYAQAILYARFYEDSRRDYRAARACIEAALAAAARMPPGDLQVVNTAFLHNTLALVEMREGKPDLACRLLTDAIADIAREAPGSFATDAPILFLNRARLHGRQGRPEEALDDLQRVHELEPSHEQAWVARALIHHDAGRHAEALAAYDQAILWGPPHVKTLHNRANCLCALGRHGEAQTAFGRVLEIGPDDLAARIDRACLSQALGDVEAMARDIEAGLASAPDDARLLCLRGVAEMADRRNEEALASFQGALDRDPDLADAWANRAIVRVRRGELEQALADVDRALTLRDDPVIRRNRERILQRLPSRLEA